MTLFNLFIIISATIISANQMVLRAGSIFHFLGPVIESEFFLIAHGNVISRASCHVLNRLPLSNYVVCFAPRDYWGKILIAGTISQKPLVEIIVYPFEINPQVHLVQGLLGHGGCGLVFNAISLFNGRFEKTVIKTNMRNAKFCQVDTLGNEIEILRNMGDHYPTGLIRPDVRFVPPLYLDDNQPDFRALVLPQLDMDLNAEHQLTDERFSCEKMMHLAKDILTGISQIHAAGVVHNDIKPDNILVKNGNYYITDFGLSCKNTTLTKCRRSGTLGYFHPVLFTDMQFNEKVDMFSFAITLLEVMLGDYYFPFESRGEKGHFEYVLLLTGPMGMPANKQYIKVIETAKRKVGDTLSPTPKEHWANIKKLETFNTCPNLNQIITSCLKWELDEIPSAQQLLSTYFTPKRSNEDESRQSLKRRRTV